MLILLSVAQENMLDYVMLKLGVDTETLQNPVAMTETLCNPAYSRSRAFSLLHLTSALPV